MSAVVATSGADIAPRRWALRVRAACAALAFAASLFCAAPAIAQDAAIPALDSPVVDTTGTLDAAQKQALEQRAYALQQRKGSQLQVLIVPTTRPETIEQYAVRAFETWKLGRKGVDDAVLLVVAKNDRKVKIEVGYGLEGAIPDITADRIIREYMAPKFRAGDYGGGIDDAAAALTQLIDGEPLPEPIAEPPSRSGDGGGWLFALFAAFIAASVARGLFSRAPAGIRGVLSGGAAGGVAWLLSSLFPLAAGAAVLGLLFGLTKASTGGFASGGGWGGFGGGGWSGGGGSGGSWGGGGGGGWSGGGGSSGGGGASGSW